MTSYPLEGIRVLNFGVSVVAPMTARYLSDFGAEVIKIESKGRMDSIRYPAMLGKGVPFEDMVETGVTHLDLNRNAKYIQANLKSPKTIELMKKLVKVSDVVIQNFAPGVMDRLGLGYEDLKKVNPGIIMLSLSAVGKDGPLYDLMTYGPTIAGLCGVQSMLGYPDGEPAQDYAVSDYCGANYGAFLIMSALRYRAKTGKGQEIDMGQAAPMFALLGEALMDYTMNNRVAGMQGNRRTGFVPYNFYRCKPDPMSIYPPEDQWVSICVKTEEEWRSLCDVMGNPAWTSDEKFANRSNRCKNQEELDKKITEWTINQRSYEVTYKLQAAGVAAMAHLDSENRLVDPHIMARGVYGLMDTAVVKKVVTPRTSLRLSRSEAKFERPSRLGEDNNYVYGDLLKLSKEEIAKLAEEKVIF